LSALEHQLEEIRTALSELRANTSSSPETRKQLDSLFRRVHSLKAAASADGLTELSQAAHELENVLHSLRVGQSTLDDTLLRQLTETLPAHVLSDEIWNSLTAHEKHALQQSISEGANISVIEASFDVTDFDREFQELKTKLNSEGEVIAVAPRVASERPEQINFRIVYASRGSVFQRAVRAGQAAAVALGKQIEFATDGTDVLIDQRIGDVIADPLLHLVRNAVDHGIEQRGTVTIAVEKVSDQLTIRVTDDGRGIDPQVIDKIFEPGFSTARAVSNISGRGVGLDVVKASIESAGGSITVKSDLDRGSSFEIRIPL
jgi:two-component system chemotaxis sensor kinase CheA